MRDTHNKRQQELVKRLQKKQDRELQAVAASACPGTSVLKDTKRAANKQSPPSTVLKPHAVATPARPSKKPRASSAPPVTPSPDEEDDSSTEVSASAVDLEVAPLTIAKTPKFGVRGTDLSLDLQQDDDCSALTKEEEGFLPDIMAKTKKAAPSAKEKRLQQELNEKEEAMEEQGLQLHAANVKLEELEKVLKAAKVPGGAKVKDELERLCQSTGNLRASNKKLVEANDAFAATEEGLNTHIRELEGRIKDLEAQLRDLQANGQPVSPKTSEEVQTLKLELKEANKTVDKFKSKFMTVHTQHNKDTETIKSLQFEIEQLKKAPQPAAAPTTMVVQDETLVVDLEKLKKENGKLSHTNSTLLEQLKNAKNALKAAGKKSQDEVSKNVVEIIKGWVKEVGYHQYRFVVGKDQQTKYCRAVYDGIKSDPKLRFDDNTNPETYMPFVEFERIYDASCRDALNKRRQYTQTLCQAAVVGEFVPVFRVVSTYALCHLRQISSHCPYLAFVKKFQRMPTLDDLKTVYDLPPDTDPKYNEKKDILLWYFDSYLPAAAGNKAYGPTVRYYKRSTKSVKIGGLRLAVIPMQVEAFGILVFENCLPKWQHICPKKAEDPTWTVPKQKKDDPANDKYHVTKWSDGKIGQVQGGGWSQEGYDAFNHYLTHVSKIRADDKANSWTIHNFALQLMRTENGITEDAPAPSKKRKRGKNAQLAPHNPGPKWDMPEVEDTFSVGSEISSGERLDQQDEL